MGLDMYLEKEVYIGANYEHRQVTGKVDITIKDKHLDIPFNQIATITLDVAYWRKANQIMNWFTKHPDWDEDRQEVSVYGKDLLDLASLCNTVLADHSKAEELLPSMEGFFFGSTDYDEYYFADLQDTVDMLKDTDPQEVYKFTVSW